MQLRTEDGKLTLGSVYKLIVVGWLLSFGVFFGVIALILVALVFASGETLLVNGEMVPRDALLGQIWPFFLLVPIAIPFQALMMGGLVTGGLWLYSLRSPLYVTEVTPNRSPAP